MAALEPKHASRRLWQQTGDIYGESALRLGNRLVPPVRPFDIHGRHPLALWIALTIPQDGTCTAALEPKHASRSL